MEFTFTDEQLELQQRIRDCCRREVAPGAAALDEASGERAQELLRERFRTLAREELLGLGLPAEAGGSGDDFLGAVLLHQELGEACPATALSVLSSVGLCARALCEWGGEAERDAFLKDLLGGEAIGAWADLEPDTTRTYCYLSATFVDDMVVLSYYVGRLERPLECLRIARVPLAWFYE